MNPFAVRKEINSIRNVHFPIESMDERNYRWYLGTTGTTGTTDKTSADPVTGKTAAQPTCTDDVSSSTQVLDGDDDDDADADADVFGTTTHSRLIDDQ